MNIKTPIYLDNNSTTQIDPRVLESMMPYLQDRFGNASSNHSFGWMAMSAVDNARKNIASFLQVSPNEIYFTSGATESINLVHFGLTESANPDNFHIITSNIEHSAATESLNYLLHKGFNVSIVEVDKTGTIDPSRIIAALTQDTKVVSIIFANNEIGTINDIKAIGHICRENDLLLHVDATQAVGKIKLDLSELNVDFLSFTAHKIYGPKGIGALYINKNNPKAKLAKRLFGGTQEGSIKPGTLNVASIVGFGKAIEICSEEITKDFEHTKSLRDSFYKNIVSNIDGVFINGSMENRLPNNLNFYMEAVHSDKLILELRDLAFSSSAACDSGLEKPSRILKAIGLTDEQALSSVRFGFGRFNTKDEIDYASKKIIESVNKLRTISKNKSHNYKQITQPS